MTKEISHTKPLSPLQAMIQKKNSAKKEKNHESEDQSQIIQTNKSENEKIYRIDPFECRNWYLADRPASELSSVDNLAKEFSDPKIGQKVPCTVRTVTDDPKVKYEVITGEQRWRAAKKAGTKLKVIIKVLGDSDAAIEQILENRRDNLSDYAQGMSYAKLLKNSLLKQKSLENILNISAVQINRLLSFSQVNKSVWEIIGDTKNISARTGAEIRSILKKNPAHIEIIKDLAPQISEGKIGASSLQKEVKKLESTRVARRLEKREVKNLSGRHLFTWRGDSNGNISISFPKDIRSNVDQEAIELALQHEMEKQLS